MIKTTFTRIVLLCLALSGCAKISTIPSEIEQYEMSYETLKTSLKTCSGKGKLQASGSITGQLLFSFTSKNDSTHIMFKDILGRRTMYMQLFQDDTQIWDMRKNRRYSYDLFIEQFPAIQFFSPLDLTKVMWGTNPFEESKDLSELTSLNVSLVLSSELTQFGSVTSGLEFQDKENNHTISLEITNREYGTWNPSIVRNIPSTVKWN